jgi:IclR family acetate operon transcriptional repressor
MIQSQMNPSIVVREDASSRSTERTLAILEYLGRFRKGQSASEIGRALSLPVNTVGRITETMNKRGWLYRREDDRRYVLTNRVADLTRPQVNDKSLTMCAWDALRNLRDQTGETTQLAVMSERKCLILEQCVSDQPIKVSGKVGMRVPCFSCAPGKSILAELPGDELDAYFKKVTLKKFTKTTLSTVSSLKKELTRVTACGYAVDLAEGLEGIHCVSAVILDDYEYPVGSITTIGPAFRMQPARFEEIGKTCVRAAAQIREKILA